VLARADAALYAAKAAGRNRYAFFAPGEGSQGKAVFPRSQPSFLEPPEGEG